MEQLNLRFYQEQYDRFVDDEITVDEFLNEICNEGGSHNDLDEGHHGEIIGALLRNYSTEGGSPEIEDFYVSDSELNSITNVGKVTFSYTVSYYFPCADMNKEDEDYETIRFTIDLKNLMLILNFPSYEKLSTSEEF